MTRDKANERREARYQRGRAAQARVLARLTDAVERINVAQQFRDVNGGTVAQLAHARRFLRDGRDEAEDLPWISVSDEDADHLVRVLTDMLSQARMKLP